jgi:hypothetical protein
LRPIPLLLVLLPSIALADPADDEDALPDTMPALRETPDPGLIQDDWPEPSFRWWWGTPVEAPADVVVVQVPVAAPCEVPEVEAPALDGPDRTGADGLWVAPEGLIG